MQPVEKESRPPAAVQHFLTWFILGAIAAVVIGWVAAMIHLSGRAPVGLVSLVVGLALGAVLLGLAAVVKVTYRKRLLVAAAFLAVVTVLAEHAWLYSDFRRQWHEARAKSPHVAMFRPETPWTPAEYFSHELTPGRAALWCLDAVVITMATVGTVWALRRVAQ